LILVELAPDVTASLRAMKDRGTPPPRCHKGVIESAIAGAVRRLVDGALSGGVRPWDLKELQRRVELEVVSEDLGKGKTETSYRYQWTEGDRSILAEEVKSEICDGATPYSTYLRGVIVDGERGGLLTGRDDSALIVEN
jgi:hypothetical protein